MKPKPTTIEVHMLPDERLDTANAAAYLGLSQKSLAMMRCRGEGPRFKKVGGSRVFYYLDDLDAWLDAGTRFRSTAEASNALQLS